jgi:signal transduction histidine kinase
MMDMFSPHLEEILQFEFIESTVDILSTTASLQDIKIEFVQEKKHDKIVIIDKLRVQQILINLLSNAIKFSNKGQQIYVYASYLKLTTSTLQLLVKVQDRGTGLLAEDVFEREG